MKKAACILLSLMILCFASVSSGESPVSAQNISFGDVVIFGHYDQDNASDNGPEPIEWIVLDVQDGQALLLSNHGLDSRAFNTEYTDITWEKCTLRTWLNSDFMNAAFSGEEQSRILAAEVDNSDSQGLDWTEYGGTATTGGNNTLDRLFLLSYAEANRYLNVTWENGSNKKSLCIPTAYAIARGAWTRDGNGWWWLRSPGYFQGSVAVVDHNGPIRTGGSDRASGMVRPALRVNLESETY